MDVLVRTVGARCNQETDVRMIHASAGLLLARWTETKRHSCSLKVMLLSFSSLGNSVAADAAELELTFEMALAFCSVVFVSALRDFRHCISQTA